MQPCAVPGSSPGGMTLRDLSRSHVKRESAFCFTECAAEDCPLTYTWYFRSHSSNSFIFKPPHSLCDIG